MARQSAATKAVAEAAEQLQQQQAGSSTNEAQAPVAPTNTAGAENTGPAATGQTTEAPGADAAPTVVDPTASTTGQDAHLIQGDQGDTDQGQLNQDAEPDEIDALWVESRPASIRRCGFRFTREGIGIALIALTDKQLQQLESDPDLVTQRCSFLDKVQG